MDARRTTKRTGLRYIIITMIVLTAACLLFTGAASGESGTVQVSVRVSPAIEISHDGSVTSNTSVRVQMVDGVLTIISL